MPALAQVRDGDLKVPGALVDAVRGARLQHAQPCSSGAHSKQLKLPERVASSLRHGICST